MREYTAMHEEHFLSSLLREAGEDKKERVREADKETTEEMSKKRTREGVRERDADCQKKVYQPCLCCGL